MMGRWSHLRAGYEDWGRVRMPLPQRMVLTDRVLGTLWALTHDASVTAPAVEPYNPRLHTDAMIYAENDGPRAESNPNFRLILASGSLSFELDPLPIAEGQGKAQINQAQPRQPRILTRRGFQRRTLHLDVGQYGNLTFEEIVV